MPMVIRYLLAGAILCWANPALADQLWQLGGAKSKPALTEATESSYLLRDQTALRELLTRAPPESSGDSTYLIRIPMPGGRLQTFSIVESSIMEAGLEAQLPGLRSYKVYGVDDPSASGRVEITPQGFGGMIHTSAGRVFIDPDSINGAEDVYVSRFARRDRQASGFACGVDSMDSDISLQQNFAARAQNRVPGNLLTYRIAVSATEEYIAAISPTRKGSMPSPRFRMTTMAGSAAACRLFTNMPTA